MNPFQDLGFYPADILLPRPGIDLTRWAVVACDQFTSQPEYWRAVEAEVGEAPSALRLILPEAELDCPDVETRIAAVNAAMEQYLASGMFQTLEKSLLYIRRTQADGRVRQGLMGMVDLECYDFAPGSGARIRATEGTVLSRIPPRVQVRREAPLELPHVMLLIDDPDGTVIEPLAAVREDRKRQYAFALQQGGGFLEAWRLEEDQAEAAASALAALCSPAEQRRKYGKEGPPMLFAVGDGNHSLAAAKQCWEEVKARLPEDRRASCPARFALAEVVNLHDQSLEFQPIHRLLSGVEPEAVLRDFQAFYPEAHAGAGKGHVIAYAHAGGEGQLTVPAPQSRLATGTLQIFLDAWLKEHPGELDYIHGDDTVLRLGRRPGYLAFRLPLMGKEQLFPTVLSDGVLPRKTFSMGRAQDKRYYVEARRIR